MYLVECGADKQETIQALEQFADECNANRDARSLKPVRFNGLPRQTLLKPAHTGHKLQGQVFMLGDRVVMVSDSAAGGIPLGLKGVVVGVGNKDIDVVWDKPFMGGETLQGR